MSEINEDELFECKLLFRFEEHNRSQTYLDRVSYIYKSSKLVHPKMCKRIGNLRAKIFVNLLLSFYEDKEKTFIEESNKTISNNYLYKL